MHDSLVSIEPFSGPSNSCPPRTAPWGSQTRHGWTRPAAPGEGGPWLLAEGRLPPARSSPTSERSRPCAEESQCAGAGKPSGRDSSAHPCTPPYSAATVVHALQAHECARTSIERLAGVLPLVVLPLQSPSDSGIRSRGLPGPAGRRRARRLIARRPPAGRARGALCRCRPALTAAAAQPRLVMGLSPGKGTEDG